MARALPRFLAIMGLSDSRPEPFPRLLIPSGRWGSVAASPPMSGFILIWRTGHLHWCHEAESGSLALRFAGLLPRFPPAGLRRLAPVPLHACMHERAIYMVNSFQFTRSARLSLVCQMNTNEHGLSPPASHFPPAVCRSSVAPKRRAGRRLQLHKLFREPKLNLGYVQRRPDQVYHRGLRRHYAERSSRPDDSSMPRWPRIAMHPFS